MLLHKMTPLVTRETECRCFFCCQHSNPRFTFLFSTQELASQPWWLRCFGYVSWILVVSKLMAKISNPWVWRSWGRRLLSFRKISSDILRYDTHKFRMIGCSKCLLVRWWIYPVLVCIIMSVLDQSSLFRVRRKRRYQLLGLGSLWRSWLWVAAHTWCTWSTHLLKQQRPEPEYNWATELSEESPDW